MTVWILLTFLLPSTPAPLARDGMDAPTDAVRYRGIERLLAKFDAEAEAPPARAR